MPVLAGEPRFVMNVLISPWSSESLGGMLAAFNCARNQAAGVAMVANKIIYIPFELVEPTTFVKILTSNGTVTAGNLDVGIYDADGTRLVSIGSTVASSGVVQEFDITDLRLGPGRYYLAVVANNTGVSLLAGSYGIAGVMASLGIKWQTGTFPLPATATFEGVASVLDLVPVVAVTGRTVI